MQASTHMEEKKGKKWALGVLRTESRVRSASPVHVAVLLGSLRSPPAACPILTAALQLSRWGNLGDGTIRNFFKVMQRISDPKDIIAS